MQLDQQARLAKARAQLVMDEPFFGLLALRLQLQEDPSCKDMWTNSVSLGFNASYLEGLMDLEIKGLVAQLVMSIAAGHPWRQGSRESKRWNDACKQAVDFVLVEAGFKLPRGVTLVPEFEGLPAELIYAKLQESAKKEAPPPSPKEASSGLKDPCTEDKALPGTESKDDSDESRESAGDAPSRPGEIRPAPEDAPSTEAEWKMAIQAAAQQQGRLGKKLNRLVGVALQARVDWKEALHHFVQTSTYSPDYSWSRPNRRWLSLGLYMPGLEGKNISCMVIARDTSASITESYLNAFNGEIAAIVDAYRPEKVYVVDCDAHITQVVEFEDGDMPDSLGAKGGGGTKFEPVFDWIREEGIEPSCVVYLTDLMGSFPAQEPDYPVLWAVPEGHYSRKKSPFGEVLSLALD